MFEFWPNDAIHMFRQRFMRSNPSVVHHQSSTLHQTSSLNSRSIIETNLKVPINPKLAQFIPLITKSQRIPTQAVKRTVIAIRNPEIQLKSH